MTWVEYFAELGGVSLDIRDTIRREIPFCSTYARFEEWLHYFEKDGALGCLGMQERNALESIGIVEELFDWMRKKNLHSEEVLLHEGNKFDLYLTFDVTPELIQQFWQEQERQQIEATPFLPGFTQQ